MRAIELIYKPLTMLLIATSFFLIANQANAQEKKKIIRIIEVDDKGEKVIKEINIPNDDKRIKIITDGDMVNIDSIDKFIKIRMKDVMGKNDSVHHFWIGADHGDFMSDHDFDFDFDIPIDIDIDEESFPGKHFMFFNHDSIDKDMKMYFREKEFDNKKDLDKMLEEVENGTFDPKKWDMQEVDKEKMKEHKGKGNFVIMGGKEAGMHRGKGFGYVISERDEHSRMMKVKVDNSNHVTMINSDSDTSKDGKFMTYTITTGDKDEKDANHTVWVTADSKGKSDAKVHVKTIDGKGKRSVVYIMSDEKVDSLNDSKEMTWTVEADAEGDDFEKVIVISGDAKEPHKKMKIKKMDGKSGEKDVVVSVTADENGKTEMKFTDPSNDEMKMLVKNGFSKSDTKKQIEGITFMMVAKSGNEKFTIGIKSDESGKVKLTLADEKGKTLKTEEFDHKKGKTDHDLTYKDFKSGVYFIQIQLKGKSTTKKLEITKE